MLKYTRLLVLTIIILISCSSPHQVSEQEHLAEVEAWHVHRITSLSAERGWLRLAGLFWLEHGETPFGSNTEHMIRFPEGSIATFAGTIFYDDDSITVNPATDVDIFVDEVLLTEPITFNKTASPEFTHGRLAWSFLTRDELTGLRLFDQKSYIFTNFQGIERFPVDLSWRVMATLKPHAQPTEIPIINILGQIGYVPSPGMLEFTIGDENFQLIALEAANNRLFIILGDETNRDLTYQGGRYMYVDNSGPNRRVVLDFNKAYNPPCAFSEYTTCQLPPPENRLALRVEAGEKRYVQPTK